MTLALASRRTALTPPWVRDDLWRRARAVPSLDLRFADNKSLTDSVTGASLVTFIRSSNGMFVGSAGVLQTAATDVPRFDHNPTTGESLGLLVEEQRTNLRTYSDAILVANTYSVNVGTLTTVTTATPTASATATQFTLNVGANTGNNTDGLNYGSSVTLVNSTQHTQSLFVKPAGATVLRLRSNVSGLVVDFTLTGNGAAPSPSSDLQSASIVPFPNGWYRVSWTFTTATSVPGNRSDYWTIKTNVADGTNGLYVVGAQLEVGAFPTSYIPTATAAATRNADVVSMTGANFSSWYRNSSSTFALKGRFISNQTNGILAVSIEGFEADYNYRMRILDTQFAAKRFDNGAAYEFNLPGSATAGSTYNYAVGYDDTGHAASSPLGFSSTNYPALPFQDATTLKFVPDLYRASHTIKRLTYWPQRLSNTTLQTLTQ